MRRIVGIAIAIGSIAALAIIPLTGSASGAAVRHRAPMRSFRDLDHNRIDDALDGGLPRLAPDARVRAIVLVRGPTTGEDLAALQRDAGAFTIEATWHVLGGMTALLTAGQIRTLARRDDVIQIEADREIHIAMSTARRWYGVDQAVADFGVTGDRNGAVKTYTKTDIVACIVDTGIDASHVDLNQGQVIAWKDYVNGRATPYDDNGHGTHVAGILAGQGDGSASYRGVAYGTALIGVKALNSAGSGTTTSIINGVDFCASKRTTYNVRIINLSVGSGGSSDGTDALSRAVNAAGDAGILPVVAAGNGGPAASTIGSPAAAAGASTVCSLVDPGEGGFFLSAFSSRGPTADGRTKPDICAPGERITSVKAGSGNGYTTLSGTSMATPFVAGVAVLMLDADPTLTPAALKSKLRATAQDWRSTGADNETGAGKLQAYDAIKAAGGFAGTGPGVPAHYMSNAQSLARTGAVDEWTLPVTKTSYPIALTLNVPGATSAKDFDLYVSYWTGSAWIQKAASESSTRQETISFSPSAAGTYRVTVRSYAGSGSYYLDSSYGGGAPALGSNG